MAKSSAVTMWPRGVSLHARTRLTYREACALLHIANEGLSDLNTRLDNTYKVTSVTIDRGRQFELDKTGVGTCVVDLVDEVGDFNPNNSSRVVDVLHHGAFALAHPVSGSTATLFRGYVDSIQWTPYVSGQFANVRLELVAVARQVLGLELLGVNAVEPLVRVHRDADDADVRVGPLGQEPAAQILQNARLVQIV